jgi:hypothetical protein
MSLLTADSLILAFVAASAKNGSWVTFAERSAPAGYVRVYGPSVDPHDRTQCHLVIERPNGYVSVTEALGRAIPGATPRVLPAQPIAGHPTGYASGPEYGRFTWSVDPSGWRAADAAIGELMEAFARAGIVW